MRCGGHREARAGRCWCSSTRTGRTTRRRIPLLLGALADDVALVIGSRFLGTFRDGAITGFNRMGNVGLTAVSNALFGMHVSDTQAGFRAVRKRALEGLPLRARRYDIETELLLRVHLAGGKVVEVPVTRSARSHGAAASAACATGRASCGACCRCGGTRGVGSRGESRQGARGKERKISPRRTSSLRSLRPSRPGGSLRRAHVLSPSAHQR